MFFKDKILIIPTCTDFNRGDQALVLETKKIIDEVFSNNECYMMSTGETIQCEKLGLKKFEDILKHPSRFDKKRENIRYSILLKLKWGLVASFDFLISLAILYKFTRMLIYPFLRKGVKESLKLYKESSAIFVKGGGFLHDYSKGLIGLYTIYYQLYHIKLAISLKKKVFIMPNSFGPFVNKKSKKMVNKVLDKCCLVTARESISSSSNLNTLNRNIDLYPDLAFFLDKNKSKYDLKSLLNKFKINTLKDKLVAITVRPYRFYSYDNPEQKYDDYKKSFVKFINYLTLNNYKVLLVVHTRAENEHENDESCIDDIMKMLNNNNSVYKIKDDKMNCYDLKKLYGMCKYVIGTRFHSVIFSLEQKIPCLAVTYGGNKGNGIMKDLNLSEFAIDIGEIDENTLISKFELLVKKTNEIKAKTNLYLEDCNIKYKRLIDIIKNKID